MATKRNDNWYLLSKSVSRDAERPAASRALEEAYTGLLARHQPTSVSVF